MAEFFINIFKLTFTQIAYHDISVVHIFIESHIYRSCISQDLVLICIFISNAGMKKEVVHAFMDKYGENDV